MKKIILAGIAFFLVLAVIGGTYCMALDIVVPELVFSSLDELLAAYKAVREGTADAELAELAGKVNFSELDEFYFPTEIPKEYKLFKISINYLVVAFWYLPASDLVSDEAISSAISQKKHFLFGVYRKKAESPMDVILRQFGATKKDLIGGIYLFENSSTLVWGTESTILELYMPQSFSNMKNKDKVKFVVVDAVDVETGARRPYSPPILYVRWWQKLPAWVQWMLRYLCFGWLWMKP